MQITGISTRDLKKSVFDEAEYLFDDYKINDACYLNLESKKILAVSYGNIMLPFTSYILKEFELNKFFNSSKESWLLIVDKDEVKCLTSDGKTPKITNEIEKKIISCIHALDNYGGKLDENGNQVFDLKSKAVGPHFTTNLLLGNRMDYKNPLLTTPKSVVDAFGRGSFRGEASFQILATRWDIRPEENGNPFNRQFYIVEDGKIIFYSGEISDFILDARCIQSPNKTTIKYITKDLEIKRNIFIVPQEKGLPSATECQTISIKNLENHKRNLSIICTGMFGLSNPECVEVDIIYQTVITETRLLKDKNNVVGLVPDYYPNYFKNNMRFVTLKDDKGFFDEFTQDATEFLGGGDINNPKGFDNFNNKPRMSGASFFALKKNFELGKKGTHNFDEFVGASSIEKDKNIYEKLDKEFSRLITKFNKHKKVEFELNKVISSFDEYKKFMQILSDDKTFDSYVNNALPFQVLYQTFVSRSFAQTQKGYRELGFREVQDIYASMYYLVSLGKANLVKDLLSKWIENVYKFGYANHNFFYKGKEPGMCSDDQIWLLEAVSRYITITNDKEFLNQEFKIADSNKKRKLIDTIKAIIVYSSQISVGKHGLPLLDCADWNDCLRIDDDYLNGPKKERKYHYQLVKNKETFGTPFASDYSESIMNAFLLINGINDFMGVIDDNEYKTYLENIVTKMTNNLNKYAYINDYFVRVLINKKTKNNNKYIGSKGDGLSIDPNVDGSYYLNSFTWSLLSNVASEEQIKKMLNPLDNILKTKAGYVLCSKHNLRLAGSTTAATDHYYPGDRENGGVFKHATMMLAVALLKKAKEINDKELEDKLLDDAFYMLDLVLPYKTLNNPYILKGNPRFCTQYNNSITLENIGPILSGTATWLTLAIYEIIGLKFVKDGIIIHPALNKGMHNLKANIRLENNTMLEIDINKPKNTYGDFKSAKITFDGKTSDGKISRVSDGKIHNIKIEY